jgi:hypothetical protein
MFAPGLTRNVQRAVCMLLSVLVVAVSFSFGFEGSHHDTHHGYSVTVTQLQ